MTPLLRELVTAPKAVSASSTRTSRPRIANARAVASPTTPAPMMMVSTLSIIRSGLFVQKSLPDFTDVAFLYVLADKSFTNSAGKYEVDLTVLNLFILHHQRHQPVDFARIRLGRNRKADAGQM